MVTARLLIAITIFSLVIPIIAAAGGSGSDMSGLEAEWEKTWPMVLIEGGCYEMGCGEGDIDCHESAKPAHRVCVRNFWIGKYEVTQKQWRDVMGNNPSAFKGCGSCPVEQVNWFEVQEFIRRLNKITGGRYRLPTEAEWEYAARSRGRNDKYAGTNDETAIGEYAWYKWNLDEAAGLTTMNEVVGIPVGMKKPNALGLYDMSGNVWEFVSDWLDDGYYARSPVFDPRGPHKGRDKVVRGGSFDESRLLRTTNRGRNLPGGSFLAVGFRLAREAE